MSLHTSGSERTDGPSKIAVAPPSMRVLINAGDWRGLAEILASPSSFAALWRKSPEDVMEAWVRIGAASAYRAHVTYGSWPVRDDIEAAPLAAAGQLLFWTGHVISGQALLRKAEMVAEATSDRNTVWWCRYWRLRLDDDLGRLDDSETRYRQLGDGARAAGIETLSRFAQGDVAQAISRGDRRPLVLDCLHRMEAESRASSDWACVERAVSLRAHEHRQAGASDEAMAAIEESLSLCRAHGWRVAEQWSVRVKGDIIFQRDPDAAMALYVEGQRISERLGYARGIQGALFDRAWLARTRGHLAEALELNRARAAICRRIGAVKGLQYALGELVGLTTDLGDIDGALKIAREREVVCRQASLLDNAGVSLGQQGSLLRRLKRYPEAERCHGDQEAIGLHRSNWTLRQGGLIGQAVAAAARGDAASVASARQAVETAARAAVGDVGAASALNSLAAELIDAHFEAQALPVLRSALRTARAAGSKDTLTYCLANLGLIHERLGRNDAALTFFQQQETAARDWGGKAMIARALNAQGEILAGLRRFADAVARFTEAEAIARAALCTRILFSSLLGRAAAQAAQGENGQALDAAREAVEIGSRAHYPETARGVELRDRLGGSRTAKQGPPFDRFTEWFNVRDEEDT